MRARLGLLGAGLLLASASVWFALGSQAGLLAQGNNAGVITGVVTSDKGPEAGVWVIAETENLPTRFRKIVVTNDQGKFLLPELPRSGNYKVWVRGYGLADSKPIIAAAGRDLKLTAVAAKTPQEAAQVYPASYWLSLMEPPKASEFPGTGPQGNGISPQLKTLDAWVDNMKGCVRCHQIGNKWTREVPRGQYASTIASFDERVRMGQRGAEMSGFMSRFGRQRGLQMFADWADRIAAGEVPPAPPRPKGVERNVVLTEWEWTDQMGKIHDEVSTDKRNPRLNAGGPIYGAEIANDHLAMLDPGSHSAEMMQIPTLADRSKMTAAYAPTTTSRLANIQRFNPTSIHNPMMDSKGRVWYTAQLRPPAADQPAWCKEGSDNKYAKYFPLPRAGRNVSFYDPKLRKFTMIDTCFGTHHLQFAYDADETLFLGQPGGSVFAWINTKQFDQTGNGQLSQGWCPTVVDTNGDGRITKPWNEPVTARAAASDEDIPEVSYKTFDPKLDTRVLVGAYGIIVNPVDGSVWGAQEGYPGKIIRVTIGSNPPETCMSEVYEPPSERQGFAPNSDASGFKPRGIDVDRSGVIWTGLAGSNHMASFDRRKCKTTSGPNGHEGAQCKEGWTLYPLPGPTFKGTNRRADYYYYNWVDQFNTLGLGADTPIATGTGSDSLIALLPKTGEAVVMRVPYPLGGFHPRGLDGRIDDPNAGWKGRAVYSSTGADTVWHAEGGLAVQDGKYTSVSKPILVKFQIRPDPLAN